MNQNPKRILFLILLTVIIELVLIIIQLKDTKNSLNEYREIVENRIARFPSCEENNCLKKTEKGWDNTCSFVCEFYLEGLTKKIIKNSYEPKP